LKGAVAAVCPPPNPLRGRPSLLTTAARKDLHGLLHEDPDLYLDEILEWLVIAHDIAMSRSALALHLREASITRNLVRTFY
jgi:hypothetical protein